MNTVVLSTCNELKYFWIIEIIGKFRRQCNVPITAAWFDDQFVTISSGLIFFEQLRLFLNACPIKVSQVTVPGAGAVQKPIPQPLANTDFFRRVS